MFYNIKKREAISRLSPFLLVSFQSFLDKLSNIPFLEEMRMVPSVPHAFQLPISSVTSTSFINRWTSASCSCVIEKPPFVYS